MDPKPRPNRQRYLEVLRSMTPEQRLRKACELSDNAKELFTIGLRTKHPEASEEEIQRLRMAWLQKWHNSNY